MGELFKMFAMVSIQNIMNKALFKMGWLMAFQAYYLQIPIKVFFWQTPAEFLAGSTGTRGYDGHKCNTKLVFYHFHNGICIVDIAENVKTRAIFI